VRKEYLMTTTPASKISPTAQLLDIGGYKPSADGATRRLVAVYTGDPGTGKTDRALTAPDPIVYFDIDHGTEGVIEKFVKQGKDITVIPVSWPPDATQVEYRAVWNTLITQFTTTVKLLHGTGGTIIWDSFTELVELAQWAFLGKVNEIPPTRHVVYQAPLRSIVRTMLDDSQLNGIFIHKWGKVFNSMNEYEIRGYKDMMYQVQVVVQLTLDDKGQRGQKVIKCRQNGALQGKSVPIGTFPLLSAMVWE
jgi:hypothetical protein